MQELQQYLNGVSLSVADHASAEMILASTQHALELYLNKPLEPVQVRELARSRGDGRIYLRVSPVHRILSVTSAYNGYNYSLATPFIPPVFERDDTVLQYVDYVPDLAGTYPISAGGFYSDIPDNTFVVDYVGGYNGYNDMALKMAILRVAAREVSAQHDGRPQFRRGTSEVVTTSTPVEIGWQPEELQSLQRLRRIVVV